MLDRRRVAVGAALLAVLTPTLVRAAPRKFPDFPVPSSDKQKTAADQALSVGVYVMDDPVEQKTYFGLDLRQAGVTPLWVGVANSSAEQRFWFDVAEIKFAAENVSVTPGNAAVSDSGATALVITDMFVGSLVLGLIGQSMMADASNQKANLIDRGLNSHTLGPGQTASGFVYVRRDKGHPGVGGSQLTLAAHPIPSPAGAAPMLCTVSL